MSVEPVARKNGRVWRVRWRDEQGQAHSKVLGIKKDAEFFDAEIKRRKRLGTLTELDCGTETLADFAQEWWRRYAVPNLALRTQRSYAHVWDKHVLPYLGALRLKDITTDAVESWIALLRADGVGEPTVYRALVLLQGVLRRAVEWGRLRVNPVVPVTKPQIRRQRHVRPLERHQVERLRAECRQDRDRVIIALLAYAGLRPQEMLALTWHDVTDTHLLVDKAIDYDGEPKGTKNEQNRVVPIHTDLRHILNHWREFAPSGDLVVQRRDGSGFADEDWKNWHRDVWRPITTRAGIDAVPYDLRHTFVSALIREGKSVVEVARQAGHDPVMTLRTYAHLFDAQAA